MQNSILPIAKYWNSVHYIKFNLHFGEFKNIKDFLNSNEISFLSDMELNINNIPIEYQVNKKTNTLNKYLSHNYNSNLTNRFMNYFISSLLDMRYETGDKLIFRISNKSTWQNMTMIINNPSYQQITSVTTTHPITTTTTTRRISTTTSTTLHNTTTTSTTTMAHTTTTSTTLILEKIKLNIKTLFIHIPNEIQKI